MNRVHFFTIAAANYLPKVRVLFQSLRRWHPEWKLHLAIADTPPAQSALSSIDADEIHHLSELGIPNWKRWVFYHSLIELATAIKPFVLRRLLTRPDCKAAIFLDPDIVVFSPLNDVEDAFADSDILLTPHLTVPETSLHGIIANEICTAQHGIYNLGFIGVTARREGRAFTDWWIDRVYHFCREDIPNGIYTDQRWIDFVPAFFERVRILRSPRLNVAPWNLSARRLAGSLAEGFTVNGAPLGFYHFSQVDSTANDLATASQTVAVELVRWYRRETAPLPNERLTLAAWGLSMFDNGEPILTEHRLVYRSREDLQRAFPDPFKSDPNSYLSWWQRRARLEFPALFDPATKAVEVRRLASVLTYLRIDDTVPGVSFDIDHRHKPRLDEGETTSPPINIASARRYRGVYVVAMWVEALRRKLWWS